MIYLITTQLNWTSGGTSTRNPGFWIPVLYYHFLPIFFFGIFDLKWSELKDLWKIIWQKIKEILVQLVLSCTKLADFWYPKFGFVLLPEFGYNTDPTPINSTHVSRYYYYGFSFFKLMAVIFLASLLSPAPM